MTRDRTDDAPQSPPDKSPADRYFDLWEENLRLHALKASRRAQKPDHD